MIGGWLAPQTRHFLQEEIAAFERLVTIGEYTLEEANRAFRHAIALSESVRAGTLTEEEAFALTNQFAENMRDRRGAS